MIVRWPGRIAAGSTTDHPSAFWDYFPTAVALAGAAVPAGLDGISYVPTLLGEAQPQREYLFWMFGRGARATVAVRSGKWKAVLNGIADRVELYDLSLDLGEASDVAAANPDVVARLTAIMEEAVR
jgi:arylsulfatase A-like enzyme